MYVSSVVCGGLTQRQQDHELKNACCFASDGPPRCGWLYTHVEFFYDIFYGRTYFTAFFRVLCFRAVVCVCVCVAYFRPTQEISVKISLQSIQKYYAFFYQGPERMSGRFSSLREGLVTGGGGGMGGYCIKTVTAAGKRVEARKRNDLSFSSFS